MINLEQVKLLEMKVVKAIDYIEQLTMENAAQRQKEAELQMKLESYQQRIDELEVLIMHFKEDQGRIEDSILAALDKLNQFEEAIEKSLKNKPADKVADKTAGKTDGAKTAAKQPQAPFPAQAAELNAVGSGEEKICFEIPETENGDDILDPLDSLEVEPQKKGGELEIF